MLYKKNTGLTSFKFKFVGGWGGLRNDILLIILF